MAIDYSFDVNGADAEQVAGTLKHAAAAARLVDHEAGEPGFGPAGNWLDSGLFVGAAAKAPLPFPDPVAEELGFETTVSVLFRLNSALDVEKQKHDMVRLVAAMLTELRGDAVLMFAGELVSLLRKGGQLTISNRDDFWAPDLRALLPQPYERVSLPAI
jgi:hypothetical protein